jgi:hypothetical protein
VLRETFAEYALRAPDADGLREAVEGRVRRGRARRRRWTVAGAVVTAASVVAVVALVTRVDEPVPPRPPVASEPPAPAGTRWLMTKGVRVAVPLSWWSGDHTCGVPREDSVIVGDDGGDGDCAWSYTPGLNVVWTEGARSVWEPAGAQEATDVTIDGVAAQRLVGRTEAGQYVESLVVPDRDLTVLVTTDDPAVARAVLDTARVSAGVDPRGCPVRRAETFATAPPERAGAREQMVPPGAVAASACRYGSGWVLTSRLLGARDTARLAGVFNGLAAGFAEPSDPRRDVRQIVVTFRYPTGPDVVVYVHLGGARDVGATNGTVTGPLSLTLATELRRVVGLNDVNEGRLVLPR